MKKYLLIVLLLSFSFSVYGDVSPFINIQGMLRSQQGAPVQGNFQMTFSLYDAQSGGTHHGVVIPQVPISEQMEIMAEVIMELHLMKMGTKMLAIRQCLLV